MTNIADTSKNVQHRNRLSTSHLSIVSYLNGTKKSILEEI